MSDTDEIKSRINIVEYIGKRVTLKKAGRHFKGLCPFHNEKSPSFIVSPERESFHCFGCGKGGDVFAFIMEYDHVDFPEALEELAEVTGVKLSRRTGDTPEAKLKQKIFEVNHLASEYYQYILTKHVLGENARAYLKDRGVSDKSAKTFALGYSPNSWDGLCLFLKKKGYERQLLTQAGLMTKNGYDMFRGRVMFTLKDHRGNIVGFSGRVLDPTMKESKYINTSETPVYSKSNVLYGLDVTRGAVQKENEVVVVEGEFDVISSFQEGISNVVAIKGSALTEGHVNLLKRYAERLVLALDSDMAGDAAARRGIEIADSAGLDIRVVHMPSGKDPDEAAREDPVALKKAIKDAVPIYDYFITSAVKRFDATTAFGKKKIGEELAPIFAKLENPIVQGHYVKKLAHALDAKESDITLLMRRSQKTTLAKPQEEKGDIKTSDDKLEIYVLALLLQGKPREYSWEYFSSPPVKKIVEHLVTYRESPANIPKELVPTYDEAFLWDLGDITSDEEHFAREWKQSTHALERQAVKKKIHTMTNEQIDTDALKALTDRLKVLENEA